MPFNAIHEYDANSAPNNIDIGGASIAEGCAPSGINNALRELARQIRRAVANQGSDIASAATIDLGAADGQYVKVTGAATITALGTVNAGVMRWVEFTGALTLTHNASSLKLPGAANIVTAAGDVGCFVSLGAGNWKCLGYFPASGIGAIGKHMIFVPAGALVGALTGGASLGTIETATNKHCLRTFDFDQSAIESACFTLTMPKSWNEGTVSFRPIWTFSSGAGAVVWALQAVAASDDDALDVAYGTEQIVEDTGLSAGDLHRGAESAAITVAGSPAVSDTVLFRIKRNATHGNDTLTGDARLIGLEIYLTTDSGSDA
ncbi:MAG: hypothetical protein JNN33_07705 [Rhodospirillaceae bacterium]|nr:hypothetical protein [Rhodospirillaceae bacterium]